MRFFRTTIVVALMIPASYAIARWTHPDVQQFLSDILLPFAGALTGIILATVAIIMGSVGTTFSAIASKRTDENHDALKHAFDELDRMVSELKQDCFLVIASFGIFLFIYVLTKANIPLVSIQTTSWCSKELILATVSFFFCGLSFLAMLDTVGTVFSMHRHTSCISRGK